MSSSCQAMDFVKFVYMCSNDMSSVMYGMAWRFPCVDCCHSDPFCTILVCEI